MGPGRPGPTASEGRLSLRWGARVPPAGPSPARRCRESSPQRGPRGSGVDQDQRLMSPRGAERSGPTHILKLTLSGTPLHSQRDIPALSRFSPLHRWRNRDSDLTGARLQPTEQGRLLHTFPPWEGSPQLREEAAPLCCCPQLRAAPPCSRGPRLHSGLRFCPHPEGTPRCLRSRSTHPGNLPACAVEPVLRS